MAIVYDFDLEENFPETKKASSSFWRKSFPRIFNGCHNIFSLNGICDGKTAKKI